MDLGRRSPVRSAGKWKANAPFQRGCRALKSVSSVAATSLSGIVCGFDMVGRWDRDDVGPVRHSLWLSRGGLWHWDDVGSHEASDFGATSKLIRSCSVGATKNRSRHCLSWHQTRGLESAWTNVETRPHVVEDPVRSGFHRAIAKQSDEFACRLSRPGRMTGMATAV